MADRVVEMSPSAVEAQLVGFPYEHMECVMAMRLPIDTSGLTLLVGLAPEPVVDFETRRPKADENGEPMYQLQLVALGSEGAEVITVKVAGEPKGLAAGVPVKVLGLVALPWSMGDRSGVSFKAARIEALASTSSTAAAAGSSTGSPVSAKTAA